MREAIVKPLLSLLAPGGHQGRLSILIYHRVLAAPDVLRPGEPDAAAFRWQMQLLARWFRPLSLDEAVRRLHEGCLPARTVCVTFDDGYADNAEVALPILQSEGMTATFFIATGFLNGGRMFNDSVIETVRRLPSGIHDLTDFGLGPYAVYDADSRIAAYSAIIRYAKYLPQAEREDLVRRLAERIDTPLPNDLMMKQEQVCELHRAGMRIGAHTVSHPILARLADADAAREIQQGRKELENMIDQPVMFFAYPNGRPGQDYCKQHVAMVRDAGFTGAVSTSWGTANRASDLFQLPRFTPWDRTPTRFMMRLLRNGRQFPETVS